MVLESTSLLSEFMAILTLAPVFSDVDPFGSGIFGADHLNVVLLGTEHFVIDFWGQSLAAKKAYCMQILIERNSAGNKDYRHSL